VQNKASVKKIVQINAVANISSIILLIYKNILINFYSLQQFHININNNIKKKNKSAIEKISVIYKLLLYNLLYFINRSR